MNDGVCLLWAVLTDPADDAPRLVYADWLEERGRSVRARFIRLAVHVSRDRPGPYAHLRALAAGRFRRKRKAWTGLDSSWYDGDLRNTAWDRGFVSGVRCPTRTFLERADYLFRAQPLRDVHLTDRQPCLEEGLWGWYDWGLALETTPSPLAGPHSVPPCLRYPYLEDSKHGETARGGAFYDTPEAAEAALSAACVAYGRKVAGLPPL